MDDQFKINGTIWPSIGSQTVSCTIVSNNNARISFLTHPTSHFHRTEYDAYRSDLDFYTTAPKTDVNQSRQRETKDKYDKQKQDFERLRADVQIKIKFLDENRVRVKERLRDCRRFFSFTIFFWTLLVAEALNEFLFFVVCT